MGMLDGAELPSAPLSQELCHQYAHESQLRALGSSKATREVVPPDRVTIGCMPFLLKPIAVLYFFHEASLQFRAMHIDRRSFP
jgi:hypothetical protein